MAALPYIQFYVADYLADTAHLTAAQHGAYLLLIFNYWQRGKPLNNSNERLTNVARMSNDEWAIAKPVLAEFFIIDGDEWRHLRIDRDLAAINEKSVKASAAGKASAAKKATSAQRPFNVRSTFVQQTFNHTDTDTDTDTDKNKESAQVRQIPSGLDIDVWQRWFDFRRAIKKPIKPPSVEAAQKALAAYGQDQAAVVEQSIANGWQGLFQLKTGEQNGQDQQNGRRDTRSKAKQHSDKLDEIARRSIERERASRALDCGDIQTLSGEIWPQVDVGNDRN